MILLTKQIRKNRIASSCIFWYPYRAAVRTTPYRIMYSRLQNTWCFCKTHERKNGQAKAVEWGWKRSVQDRVETHKKKLLAPGKNWFSAWIIIHVFRKQNRLFTVKRLPYFLEYAPRRLFRNGSVALIGRRTLNRARWRGGEGGCLLSFPFN